MSLKLIFPARRVAGEDGGEDGAADIPHGASLRTGLRGGGLWHSIAMEVDTGAKRSIERKVTAARRLWNNCYLCDSV